MQRLKIHRPDGFKSHAPEAGRAAARAAAIAAALAAAASGGAWADEPNPYYIGATASLSHDSNVYRTPNGRGDTYGGLGLVAGFDQSINRQRLYADLNVRNNRYAREKTLDNVSYGLNAGWDWATIDKLSGGVSVGATQGLASYNYNNTSRPTTARDVLNTEQLGARVLWGGDAALNLTGAYGYNRVSYTETIANDSSQHSASLGASYRVGPTLRLGTALRLTRATQPNAVQTAPGVYESNKTNGRNIDLTADWSSTAQTYLNARLSWTNQTNSGLNNRDFSGLTGGLIANYAPTSRITFNASLSRDTGANSSFFSQTNPITGQRSANQAANNQTFDNFGAGATYAVTSKISLNSGLQYRRGNIVDQIFVGTVALNNEYTDKTLDASIGLNYAVARNWSMNCKYDYVKRDVSGALPYAYNANVVGCTAQFTLR
jgi:hypothetical protein